MGVAWARESEKLMVYTVTGELAIADMQAIETETDELILGGENWKVLVLLKDFEGWSKEEGWGNTTLVEKTDKNVDRMALVGPIEWRDQVEMFTLKGMRPVEIEYFTTETEARDWLAE